MKRIIILIGLVIASPILAQAQNAGWQIPPGANTPRALNTPGTPMNRANVDTWGNQLISLQAGTASASNPIVLEDTAVASGQGLMMSGGVNNRTLAAFNSTSLDATPIGVDDGGQVFVIPTAPSGASGLYSSTRFEDATFGDQNAVSVAGGQALSAIAQSVGTSGDIAPVAMDLGNRLVTTMAPAGESFYSCSSAQTTNGNFLIKANVASNRHYITSITCGNNSAVATAIAITDGSGGSNMSYGGLPALANGGTLNQVFPVPLRGTSNTGIYMNIGTTGTNTICCAQGYLSTI